jgi:asparagine synthetase B (glutamine-hydrolysing)
MCGIAGFVGAGDREILVRMTSMLAHRGPDDSGYWDNRNVFSVIAGSRSSTSPAAINRWRQQTAN